MPGEWRHPRKRITDDLDTEMPAPVLGTGVTGMAMAFIDDVERNRREGSLERGADRGDALLAWKWPAHGSTRRNGRTSTR